MNEEKEDELPQEVSDWLEQPYTKVALERLKTEHKRFVLGGLLIAAKMSSDPKVSLWYARWAAMEDLEAFLSTGKYPLT